MQDVPKEKSPQRYCNAVQLDFCDPPYCHKIINI